MIISLIYVSRCLIVPADHKREIDDIVTSSIERNARLEVRGALLFTEMHFAQLLEGPEAAVDEVMASIERDIRHEHITIIERKPIDGYRFPDWGLAYWGSASYMDRKIETVLRKSDGLMQPGQTAQLFELIQRLARESNAQDAPIGKPSQS